MFSPWEIATEIADILCGATVKITMQSSIDRSIENKQLAVHSDDVRRSFRERDYQRCAKHQKEKRRRLWCKVLTLGGAN
jgi:hypothetical protein